MKYYPERDLEMDSLFGGHVKITDKPLWTSGPLAGTTGEKKKRTHKRKPWVYKSEYDTLKLKYDILRWVTAILFVSLLVALKS
jgi:hypothetical protein